MTEHDGIARVEINETIKNISMEIDGSKTNSLSVDRTSTFSSKLLEVVPSKRELKQYFAVILCGFTLWCTSWFVLQDAVLPGTAIFNMAGIVVAGYVFGHVLERYTTISAMAGMTLVGALYRSFGQTNILEDPVADNIDYHLRRIYPVLILTKGPLSWNWPYIKNNSVKVFLLATLPWIVECLSTAIFTHVLLEYPWYWGLHLGSILSSVSPAVVVPTVMALNSKGFGRRNKIALLVANAGGLDTTFTEGMFGVINSAIFYPAPPAYRVIKAVLAIFVGIGLGVAWGVVSDTLPNHTDPYVATLRSLLIFSGGIFLTYASGYLGWGGTSGVAVMVCAVTAATRWSRRDWPINSNPVATVYKVLWLIFEPMLFTLSGYFLEVSQMTLKELGLIVACLFLALLLRLLTAFLIAIANRLSIKESLFVAVTWIPKAIVEAVLVRAATDSLWKDGTSEQDKKIAAQHANIIVIAILLMTTLGSGLTTILGPILLSQDSKIRDSDFHNSASIPPLHSYDFKIINMFTEATISSRAICYETESNSFNAIQGAEMKLDKRIYDKHHKKEAKTLPESSENVTSDKVIPQNILVKEKSWWTAIKLDFVHYLTLVVIGILTWGLLWSAFGNNWRWDGPWFRIAAVAVVAWGSGLLFQELTTLPPLLAALLTGIFARHFGILDMRHHINIDAFLRKIYPVIILGKASLAWDINYMKSNWRQVVALGTVPWAVEVTTTAICSHYFLDFPWLWGFMLGSIYASVSCAVIMPPVQRHTKDADRTQNWPQLICTAGGTDTALSVGVYGLIHSFMFTDAIDLYRYIKAGLTLFAGAGLGVIWGSLAKLFPHSADSYVTELRILFVLVGGLLANFFTSAVGWGGTGGVAVLACNATAAKYWSEKGWKLNQNPASTAYRVLWSACEPMLFAYTGTFFVIHTTLSDTMIKGFGILVITLTTRLLTTALVCWNLSMKEKLFICCTWIPKSIVEAVLSPLAIDTLLMKNAGEDHEMRQAEDIMRLLVQAILITTPIGFLLTKHLGPFLLCKQRKGNKTDLESHKSP
ncbi:unnamed protein product, partial [Iphiclides podalirius]